MEGEYSKNTGIVKTFSTVDYVLFALTLGISTIIGIFFAIKDRKKNTSEEYLLGGRSMNLIPVTLSLAASFISALTLIGTPVEIYRFNTMYLWMCVAIFVSIFFAAHLFVPFFYELGVTSVFEYIEMRFGSLVRLLVAVLYIIQMMVYMAFVLYAPSLAISSVTGFELYHSIAAVGCVCIFYTAAGGIKAVIWTDTFQVFVILAGMIAVLIKGCMIEGGFQKVWDTADKGGRIEFTDYSFNPSTRHSIWTLGVGGIFFWGAIYGVNQAQIQRARSLPTLEKAQLSMWLNVPGLCGVIIMCSFIGLTIYSFYRDCDPVKFGLIERNDQLLPLYVMDILGHLEGLPGVLVSAIFSGSLSTVSSGLNAIAAVILQDFIKPFCCHRISEFKAAMISRVLVVIFGGVALGVAFAAPFLGQIMQASYSVYGYVNGPILGCFVIGILMPWTNRWGAGIGTLVSLTFMLWIGFGTFINKVYTGVPSPVSTTGCNWNVTSTVPTTTSSIMTTVSTQPQPVAAEEEDILRPMYSMSYLWYSGAGMMISVIVSTVVSLITGVNDYKKMNPMLVSSWVRGIFNVGEEYDPMADEGMQLKTKQDNESLSTKL